MKRLVSWLMSGVLLAGLLLGLVMAPAAQAAELRNVADAKIAERGDKIDINNCSVRRFQAFPGMYPTLAGKIVLGGPYSSVDDLLKLDLTPRQKELVEKYKDNFTVTEASIALNEGFDRINDGRHYTKYLTGQIEADFLDVDDEPDIATSEAHRRVEGRAGRTVGPREPGSVDHDEPGRRDAEPFDARPHDLDAVLRGAGAAGVDGDILEQHLGPEVVARGEHAPRDLLEAG